MTTSVFTHGAQALLAELQERERIVSLVQKFADTGGEHRLSIAIDHPDPDVKAAVEAIAARNIPSSILLKGFVKFAYDEAVRARHELIAYCRPHDNAETARAPE